MRAMLLYSVYIKVLRIDTMLASFLIPLIYRLDVQTDSSKSNKRTVYKIKESIKEITERANHALGIAVGLAHARGAKPLVPRPRGSDMVLLKQHLDRSRLQLRNNNNKGLPLAAITARGGGSGLRFPGKSHLVLPGKSHMVKNFFPPSHHFSHQGIPVKGHNALSAEFRRVAAHRNMLAREAVMLKNKIHAFNLMASQHKKMREHMIMQRFHQDQETKRHQQQRQQQLQQQRHEQLGRHEQGDLRGRVAHGEHVRGKPTGMRGHAMGFGRDGVMGAGDESVGGMGRVNIAKVQLLNDKHDRFNRKHSTVILASARKHKKDRGLGSKEGGLDANNGGGLGPRPSMEDADVVKSAEDGVQVIPDTEDVVISPKNVKTVPHGVVSQMTQPPLVPADHKQPRPLRRDQAPAGVKGKWGEGEEAAPGINIIPDDDDVMVTGKGADAVANPIQKQENDAVKLHNNNNNNNYNNNNNNNNNNAKKKSRPIEIDVIHHGKSTSYHVHLDDVKGIHEHETSSAPLVDQDIEEQEEKTRSFPHMPWSKSKKGENPLLHQTSPFDEEILKTAATPVFINKQELKSSFVLHDSEDSDKRTLHMFKNFSEFEGEPHKRHHHKTSSGRSGSGKSSEDSKFVLHITKIFGFSDPQNTMISKFAFDDITMH